MSKRSVTRGTANVFADIGVPHPEEALAKAKLAQQIASIIERQGLTQDEAAEILGVDQPKVSALIRGRLSGFSTERLIRFLTALGRDVQIVIRRHRRSDHEGKISIIQG